MCAHTCIHVHVGCVHMYTRTRRVCARVCVCLYIDKRLVEWPSYFTSFGLDNLFINNPFAFCMAEYFTVNVSSWIWTWSFRSVSVTMALSCPLRAVSQCMECWILPRRASRWVCGVSERKVVILLLSNVFFFLEFSIINIKMWCTC